MKGIIFRLGSFLLLIIVFLAGVAMGVYYAPEIAVLLRGYTGIDILRDESSTIPTTEEISTDSFLTMPLLSEPLPLIYSDTLDEARIQEYLKQGAVVLPLGTMFGESGNVVVTAHSTGSESFGKYRFAFAKLSELKEGDTYTITTPQGTYTYRVYGKEIVWPHQVDRLPNDDRSTVTLVTCWPLWTNLKRLLVHSELIEQN